MRSMKVAWTLLCLSVWIGTNSYAQSLKTVDYVDPFIGTGGHGHTHPSAVAPHGMIQAGPDTRISGWDSASGYYFGDPTIVGFTHSHLSGTGAIDRLDVLLMPTVGPSHFYRGPEESPHKGYRSTYAGEQARPGYYAVELLEDQIDVQIAATTRAAIHQYDFSKEGDRRLTIDLQHRFDTWVRDSEIKVLSPTRVVGLRRTWSWAKNQKIFYCMSFSEPIINKQSRYRLMSLDLIKASLNFGPDIERLKVKVGLSPVDQDGACRNLDQEIPHWDLDQVALETSREWESQLSRVAIDDHQDNHLERKKIYYTALYHSLLAPNIYQDVDGRYRGMDDQIYTGPQGSYYTIYSLWDTYRALHPFLNIFMPTTNGQMIQGLLEKYKTFGRIPEWELENHDTRVMIGYHGVSVIADAWAKGVRNFDPDLALEAILASANENKKELRDYRNIGYVAHDYKSRGYKESASMTLEYAYDDWAIAQFMMQLEATHGSLPSQYPHLFNDQADPIQSFLRRSQNFRNIFDDETGFFRPRYRSGKFLEPFDPNFLNHRQNGFTEANAWQYLWSVPHDIPGLIELLGGTDAFNDKLERLFTTEIKGDAPDVSGLIGQYAHGNEPSHHIPYLFNYSGKPKRTQYWVRRLMKEMYRAMPDGLAGNEDCGQMSAWFLMNAMGLYSVTPGQSEYQLGSPLFKSIAISLENGKTFKILAHDNNDENIYVERVLLNGVEISDMTLDHHQMIQGGLLEFFMTSDPT